jgi:hypothetical protein
MVYRTCTEECETKNSKQYHFDDSRSTFTRSSAANLFYWLPDETATQNMTTTKLNDRCQLAKSRCRKEQSSISYLFQGLHVMVDTTLGTLLSYDCRITSHESIARYMVCHGRQMFHK